MSVHRIRRAVKDGFEEKFSRVWLGPGGIAFGVGTVFALFCAVLGLTSGVMELMLMSGILVLTSTCALMFAIFIEYGPLRFDPKVDQSLAEEVNESVRKGRLHPGKPFVWSGILVTAISGAFTIARGYGDWPLAAGFAGFALTALGLLLEADVAVFRLGLLNQGREKRKPRRSQPKRPGTSMPGTP